MKPYLLLLLAPLVTACVVSDDDYGPVYDYRPAKHHRHHRHHGHHAPKTVIITEPSHRGHRETVFVPNRHHDAHGHAPTKHHHNAHGHESKERHGHKSGSDVHVEVK
jgi:hypothetical protein